MAEENKSNAAPTQAVIPAQNNAPEGQQHGRQQRGNFKGGQQRGGPGGQRGGFKGGNRPPRREQPVVEKIWTPVTQLGRDVLSGKYTTLGQVVASGNKILEPEITEYLEPNYTIDFVNVGQAKGKFGGGKRKISKPTQKKTREGNKMSFFMIAISGNSNGVVGLGFGKSRETVPSREKAVKNAKMNLIQIRRGNGSWGSFGAGSTSIPFAVTGKCGSCKVKLIPAPIGTGLVVESELKKMLELAGVKDVWSKTFGQTKNKINLMKAGFDALGNLQKVKLTPQSIVGRNLKDGDKDE